MKNIECILDYSILLKNITSKEMAAELNSIANNSEEAFNSLEEKI
jgi:hypothetical protein